MLFRVPYPWNFPNLKDPLNRTLELEYITPLP